MPSNEWLQGEDDEKLQLLAKHLRGLDVAMAEIGYRYIELYWAGQDDNWDYAAYQLDKISLALRLAIERRPKRALSARTFLRTAVPPLRKAIEKKDGRSFKTQFKSFTFACNTCHTTEKVAFMHIQPPSYRQSPVRIEDR